MQRNAKGLQSKAKKHKVFYGRRPDEFVVESASSGNRYTVTALKNGGFACTCDWAIFHRTDFRPCSHCLAVIEELEIAGGRHASFWAARDEAKRQHRATPQRVGLGLWMTSRKSEARS